MPKNKASSTDSDSDSSGPDDRAPAKKAKGASGGTSSSSAAKVNEQGEKYFPLDGTKRVTVREFKGKVYVDIREFYEKDGKVLPGKKGISLTASLWNNLKTKIPDIDEELRDH